MESHQVLAILEMLRLFLMGMMLDSVILLSLVKNKRRRLDDENTISYTHTGRIPAQVQHMVKLTEGTESDCVHNLRMGRNAFGRLCIILNQLGGLTDTRGVTVAEQTCIFLSVIAHHKKNRTVFFDFNRSARTISIHFHNVLQAVLKLHSIFTKKPEPVAVNSMDPSWKWFKGCLGALDGTLIDVTIGDLEKAKYRSRKGKCQVNVLGVCDQKCNFVYVLTGWEGSAADGHVLRDVVQRPNGFKVPRGYVDFSLSGSPYSSQFGTQTSMNTGIKKTCSRRSWSLLEERVLINAFRDIIASGWKTPNGFRTGFIPQLEARMKHALPNTDLRGDPHIISKYGSWKKTFHEAYTVLNNSGMGWNSTTKTVQATPEYWDSLDQSYLHLSYIREKPFPFYEVWLEMYGKDTATGNNAFDFQGAANHVPITQAMEEVEDNTNGSPINNHVDQPGASQSATPLSNQQGIPNKGKRKRNDLGDDIVDVMSSHWTKATEAVLEVAQAMKTEMLATKNRKKLCEALRLLPITLTRAERVRAISVLAKQKDQMDVFFELSDEEKCDLVHLALDNHIRD